MAHTVHDYPGNQQLASIVQLFAPPDFVKAADAAALGAGEVPARSYADPTLRRYPCHTKAAVWLSLARHLLDRHDDPDRVRAVRARIKAAGRVFGIEGDLAELEKQAAGFERLDPARLDDRDYALVLDGPAGRERHYRLLNAGEVKTAAAYLKQYGPHFSFAERQQMADRILTKAAALGVTDLDTEWLGKQAGRGFCSGQAAAQLLYDRARTLGTLRRGPEAQEKLAELACAFLQNPELCHQTGSLVKAADLVDRLDREFRLDRLGLPAPEDVLFGLTVEKMAGTLEQYAGTPSGAVYRRADLRGLLPDDVEQLLGPTAAREILGHTGVPDAEKFAAVLGRLDRPHAERFEKRAAGLGLRPAFRQPAAEHSLLGARLERLAALVAG